MLFFCVFSHRLAASAFYGRLRKLTPAAPELCYSYPVALFQGLCKVTPELLEKHSQGRLRNRNS